jgi:hypothetical protein
MELLEAAGGVGAGVPEVGTGVTGVSLGVGVAGFGEPPARIS